MMRCKAALVAALAIGLGACATPEGSRSDPLIGVNRPIFGLNTALDDYVLAPVATGWDYVTPDTVAVHIEQFFENLRTPSYAVNDVLQGDVQQSGVEVGRFLLNTTVGIGGIFDPAQHFFGWEGRPEDFGQTLGVWGAGGGAYLMLPLAGPRGVRELVALPVDVALSPLSWVSSPGVRWGAGALDTVNSRSLSLGEVETARNAALDWYVSVRNGYRQRRERLIMNESADTEAPDDDFYDVDE